MTLDQILEERGVRLPVGEALAVLSLSAEAKRLLERVGFDAVDAIGGDWTVSDETPTRVREKLVAIGVLAQSATESLVATVGGENTASVLALRGAAEGVVCILSGQGATLLATKPSEMMELIAGFARGADESSNDWGVARCAGDQTLTLSRSAGAYRAASSAPGAMPGSIDEAVARLLAP